MYLTEMLYGLYNQGWGSPLEPQSLAPMGHWSNNSARAHAHVLRPLLTQTPGAAHTWFSIKILLFEALRIASDS